jgi:cyclase
MNSMRKSFLAIAAVALSSSAFAQQRNFDAVQIKTTQVAPGIYMLEGEGGNIGVSAGEDGVFLIDDQFAPLTPKIVAAVKTISDKSIRFLMNTHWHGDHVGGNENLGKAGVVIIAHDNVYKRMSVGGAITMLKQNYAPYPKVALPTVSFNQSASFHLNGDDVISTHLPPAHTDGDSFVRFAKANVIHTGDVFAAYRYPFIDPESGGSIKGVLKAVDVMLSLMDDNTKVIPGHGGLSSKKDVLAYRKMMSTAISKIEPMAKSGKTLQQVIDAKPLREFDEEWGKFRKPEAFVEILYSGLKLKQ